MFGKRTRMAAFGVVSVGACAVLAACAPVKMGAAATVGNQRIALSVVDSQVSNLQAAAKPYGSKVPITQAQMPDAVLSWLIRFAVRDQMAATAGVTVTQSQVQQAKDQISAEAQQAAGAGQIPPGGVNVLLVYNGLPPDLFNDLGRYQAQEIAFVKKNNGGTLPTSQTAVTAAQAQVSKADCQASKGLKIQVSPQFGRLDYTQFIVVTGSESLSRPAGPVSPAATSGATPAC